MPFGSRPRLLHLGVPELDAHCLALAFNRYHRHFCANLLKVSNFQPQVKVNRGLLIRFPAWASRCAIFSKSDQQETRAARARGRISSGSCNGFVLSRDSLQGSGVPTNLTQPNEPASHFPQRAALEVHQEAPLLILQLFKSSTCYPTLQTVIHPLQH